MTKKLRVPLITYSLYGWEDGEPFEKCNLEEPDRWEIQAADKVIIHFGEPSNIGDVTITQDPHSSELGGYLWISCIMICIYLEHQMTAKKRKYDLNTFLELGAGVSGLPTIAMNRIGTLCCGTDMRPLVKSLRKNLRANLDKSKENECAAELEWKEESSEAFEGQISVLIERFAEYDGLDAIILADCIYSEASAVALSNTLEVLCRACERRYKKSPIIFCVSELRDQAAQDKFLECVEGKFEVNHVKREDWQMCLPPSFRLDFFSLYVLNFRSSTPVSS